MSFKFQPWEDQITNNAYYRIKSSLEFDRSNIYVNMFFTKFLEETKIVSTFGLHPSGKQNSKEKENKLTQYQKEKNGSWF